MSTSALLESILHWKENYDDPENATYGWASCALCNIYHYFATGRHDLCKGCPVREATGRPYCDGTPYPQTESVLNEDDFSMSKEEACFNMWEFLVELVPEDVEIPESHLINH